MSTDRNFKNMFWKRTGKTSFLSFSFLFYKNLFYLGNIKIDQFYLGACSERIYIIEEIRYWEEPKGHLWAQICCADLYDSRNLKVMWAARRPWLKFVHSLLWKCFLNSMRLQGNYEKGCPLWLKESQKPHSRFHFWSLNRVYMQVWCESKYLGDIQGQALSAWWSCKCPWSWQGSWATLLWKVSSDSNNSMVLSVERWRQLAGQDAGGFFPLSG